MKILSRSVLSILLIAVSVATFAQGQFVKNSSTIPQGRYIVRQPMLGPLKPAKGKMVVDIVIDERGEIFSVRTNRSTTIRDVSFIRSFERVIKDDMRFNPVKHGGPGRQSGSLTYWYR